MTVYVSVSTLVNGQPIISSLGLENCFMETFYCYFMLGYWYSDYNIQLRQEFIILEIL